MAISRPSRCDGNLFGQFFTTYLPLPKAMRQQRFVVAHDRVVSVEQMLWVARNSTPALKVGPGRERFPIDKVGTHAISGVYVLEQLGNDVFRWTHPAFLLRLAPAAGGKLALETRNLRSELSLSDIMVVVGGKFLPSGQIERDETGNISFGIPAPSDPGGEIDVVVIASELCERADQNGPGRRLGLPLFSLGFEDAQVQNGLPARP